MIKMDIEALRAQLKEDEGEVNEIYADHLGYLTFGIGHLITEEDPEHGLPEGTPVSEARSKEAFDQDIQKVLEDCLRLYPDFNDLPEEVKQIIANMMFNLGLSRLSKFKRMKVAVDAQNWSAAADEMMDSKWYSQVGRRSERLVERMRSVA